MFISKKEYFRNTVSAFQDSLFLLMGGAVLSFSYLEKVDNALEHASGAHNYHIGFITTQIYTQSGKLAFFNWGFPVFVVLGIVLLYFSILSKEMAEDTEVRSPLTGADKNDSSLQEGSGADSD